MTTKLYNTLTQQIIHTAYGGYYTVDGKRPQLAPELVELVVTEQPAPNYDPTTQQATSNWQVDLQTLQYIQSWTIKNKTPYELAVEDWIHMDYALRIKCPLAFVMDDIGLKFHNWFIACGYPIERNGGYLYAYCNTISPDHQAIVDQLLLANIIELHNRPIEE